MKKTNINPVDLYCIALKGMTLAANMLVLTALCCTDDKECDGFEELTAVSHHFDTVLHKALEDIITRAGTGSVQNRITYLSRIIPSIISTAAETSVGHNSVNSLLSTQN